MESEKSAVIIGCGIAGLSSAVYLSEKGISVICVESNEKEAMETSYLNGSLVCPSLTQPWANKSNLNGVFRESLRSSNDPNKSISVLWRKLLFDKDFWRWSFHFTWNSYAPGRFDRLFASSFALSLLSKKSMDELFDSAKLRCDAGFTTGTLQLFSSQSMRERQLSVLSQVVPNLTSLRNTDVPRLFGSVLNPDLFPGGAIYSSLDTSMNIHNLCGGLRKRAEELGAKFIMGKSVTSFHMKEAAAHQIECAVLSDGSKLYADSFIAANGNEAHDIAAWAGDGRHGWPVRGFAAEVPLNHLSEVLKFNVVDDLRRIYVAPLSGRVVRLSGFCEFGSKHPDKKARQDFSQARGLVNQARRLLPENYLCNDGDEGVTYHTCWRPQTPDDLPVVGRSKFVSNLWYNCGHGHLGLTRAVGTSRLLAEMMTKEENTTDMLLGIDCSMFDPSRFRDVSVGKAVLHIYRWLCGRSP